MGREGLSGTLHIYDNSASLIVVLESCAAWGQGVGVTLNGDVAGGASYSEARRRFPCYSSCAGGRKVVCPARLSHTDLTS